MKNILNSIRQRKLAQRGVLLAILPALTVMPDFARANPTNGVVTHGFAEINSELEGHLQIFQHSNKAIINWESFNIAEGELTEFIQPGVDATALSRVVSGNPSAIYGTLKANGGHILVNTNGIMVGPSGVVDVAGMNVLSTLDIDDQDFLAGGDMVFRGVSGAGVQNFGTISSAEGDVILLGNYVDNQGSLGAVNGTVAMGAGGEILLGSAGDAKISIISAGPGGATGVNNAGSITAAAAELKSHGNVYALAVNNTGTIRATGVERVNGRVILSAGDPGGPIVNTGDISAVNADGSGGMVEINAGPIGTVELNGGSVSANGIGGGDGGSVSVVGQVVNVTGGASVTANGENGGSVTVGSPEFTELVTTETGTMISANGAGGSGGSVSILGTPDSVMTLNGDVGANGADGGTISVQGGNITQGVNSTISANGENNGGVVTVNGANVFLNGVTEANGVNGDGGTINASATENLEAGPTARISANGGVNGGNINMSAGGDLNFQGTAEANGVDGNGGLINVDAEGAMDVSGTLNANGGENGVGGTINVTGDEVVVRSSAVMGASGGTGGGNIFVGGGFQGKGDLRNSSSTTVEAGAQFNVDSTMSGNAGTAVIWSDGDTFFGGDISSRALGATGNGGLIEVSGKENLMFRGEVAANSVGGRAGTVLFDPGDISIGNGAFDITNTSVNNILQGGTSVLILTEDGDITFEDTGQQNDRHDAIQWTNSDASFGAFAGGNIFVNTHIRTSGAGSINLIGGWTGEEADFEGIFGVDTNFTPGPDDNPDGARQFIDAAGLADVEAIWEGYVEDGDFGNNGSVFMGGADLNRAINVGSRFGNTNIAASNLIMTTPQDITGNEMNYVQLGFRDSGSVFALRNQGTGFSNEVVDLNDRTLEIDNDPIVGILPIDEATGLLDLTSPLLVDKNNDGIFDGVYAVNSSGILNEFNETVGGDQVTGGGDETYIPFANNFMSTRTGNWWWQQIDAQSPDPQGLGGLLPEHGAGQSADNRADINVVTTGAVLMNSGGRAQNYAQIGHGGDATAWGDNIGLSSSDATQTFGNQMGRNFTYNGAQQSRNGHSIGRLAGVYGNINILAGVNPATVQYNSAAATNNLTGDIISPGGIVRLEGWQEVADTLANNEAQEANLNQGASSYVQIGHLGTGQFGSVQGDISVRAGGDIEILAGSQVRDHATIGHTMNGVNQWNITDDPEQQVRIFANVGDLNNPNLRKGELFANVNDGTDARGFYEAGANGGRWDDDFAGDVVTGRDGLSPLGVVAVSGRVGSTRKDISGDITVESGGEIVIRAYSTPDIRSDERDEVSEVGDIDGDNNSAFINDVADPDDVDGYNFVRDRRFAGIGHGGSSFDVWTENDNERVLLRVIDGDGTGLGSASAEVAGTSNNARRGRATTFMNIQGDITVTAADDITIQAGNDQFDHAYIGHGGADLADYETAGATVGDITVTGGGDLLVEGGGIQAEFSGNNDRDFYSYAQIGHHGIDVGTQYLAGDISVIMDGDITLTGGRYRGSGAKIGHQSSNFDDANTGSSGQVGGTFERDEEFLYGPAIDGGSPMISRTEVTETQLIYSVDENRNGVYDPDEIRVYEIGTADNPGNTSDIYVEAGANGNAGDILMDHADPGAAITQNMFANNIDDAENDIRYAPTQIGHGGNGTGKYRDNGNNIAYNFGDKTGSVTVIANGTATVDPDTELVTIDGGNITMRNGAGPIGWWTSIGHALGSDRANGTEENVNQLTGDITVTAFNNILMNDIAANETDPTNFGGPGQGLSGDPADQNHVRIGHGGSADTQDLVVLDSGEVNGIDASADIVVTAGNNIEATGGNGSFASPTQIGHGATSQENLANPNGNDRFGLQGLSGDITVRAGNSILFQGSSNALVQRIGGVTIEGLSVLNAAAVIGHGGAQMDGNLSGDISVYAGDRSLYMGNEADFVGNLDLKGSERDPEDDGIEDNLGNPAGSLYNFAQIGHWKNETDQARTGDSTGDITVVVANDLTLTGGTSSDAIVNPLAFAYAQIGHGSVGVTGLKDGDITILAGNDITTVDGINGQNLNNYTMIGNGDWIRDGTGLSTVGSGGQGTRQGDITVAAGHSIDLDRTLIGHADPAVLSGLTTILDGNTYIAVSRNFPFFGDGTEENEIGGTFDARNDSIITSAFYGRGSEVRIYMPEREDNLVDAGDLRLNEASATFEPVPGNFEDPFDASLGQDAGRADEIYLQPDLFWDNNGLSGDPDSAPFPGSLADVQGGAVATVDDPGGFPNIVDLAIGDLGSGTTEYREGNGVSGLGLYTFYYDAIQEVSSTVAAPGGGGGGAPVVVPEVVIPFIPDVEVEEPTPVVVTPFNFLPFLFIDTFDSFDRANSELNPGAGSLFNGLFALFFDEQEGDEDLKEGDPLDALFGFDDEEEEAARRRRGNSNNVGKIGGIYYVYDVNTGEYSSYREFGVPEGVILD